MVYTRLVASGYPVEDCDEVADIIYKWKNWEIIAYKAEGLSHKEIADKLWLSQPYVTNVIKKLHTMVIKTPSHS
jgi:DNA-binding MarR family transcriptional regulator